MAMLDRSTGRMLASMPRPAHRDILRAAAQPHHDEVDRIASRDRWHEVERQDRQHHRGKARQALRANDGDEFQRFDQRSHPPEPIDKDLYHLPPEEAAKVPHVCASLEEALGHLRDDHAFLTKGGVFDDDFLDPYIALKEDELTRFRMTTHPVEFDMYYAS